MVQTASSSLLERADLNRPIPENIRKLAAFVQVTEGRLDVGQHSVFCREAHPPNAHYAKAAVLFLHGQSYSSSTWLEHDTLRNFAAFGYRSMAIDLPGSGQTRGPALSQTDKPAFLLDVISHMDVKQALIVCSSMSAQYVLPLLSSDRLLCVVAVAPSNTHEIPQPSSCRTPVLLLWGDRDTSLGPTSASNLKNLPFVRLHKISQAGHAAYLHNPTEFEQVSMNFFELVRNYHSF